MNFKIASLTMMLLVAGQVMAQDVREVIAKAYIDAARQLSEQLPMRLDEYTTLTNVVARDTDLQYHYTVDAKKSEIDLDPFISHMKSNLETKACNQKDMRFTISRGGTYTYLYSGSDGASLFDFTIGKKECGLFGAAAHSYDSPLTFKKQLTDDGRVIYSNVPKECFSEGRLTCDSLHPIYGVPVRN